MLPGEQMYPPRGGAVQDCLFAIASMAFNVGPFDWPALNESLTRPSPCAPARNGNSLNEPEHHDDDQEWRPGWRFHPKRRPGQGSVSG